MKQSDDRSLEARTMMRGLNRRDFLKTAVLATGTLAVSSLPAAARKGVELAAMTRPVITNGALKIGVLLPQSQIYPGLAENFVAGMQVAAGQNELALDLRAKVVGLGLAPALRLSEELLSDGVHLVVGMLHTDVAAQLGPLFSQHRKPLMVAQVGERVISASDHNPYVFYNSLEYWRASFAMGEWAADNMGPRAFMATSFYESGFDSLYAFRRGFELAGGELIGLEVTHLPGGDRLAQVISAIQRADPDFVYAAYCGPEAQEFAKAYRGAGLAEELPLAGNSFMVDDGLLGLRSCMAWSSTLPNTANQDFLTAYDQGAGRAADAFALLGYDSVTWILEALRANGNSPGKLLAALGAVPVNSPRGRLYVDAATNTLAGPLYVHQVAQVGGTTAHTLLEQIKSEPQALANAGISGWLNTYLC